MEKQKYELGAMELYHTIANKTEIENNPFLQVILKEKVDSTKLYQAVVDALKDFPLFGCTMIRKGTYYLESIDSKIKLFNVSEHERPLAFGDNTNGYLWQICYEDYSISLEWCHAVTDGCGALEFLKRILSLYYGVNIEDKDTYTLDLGYESIYDKKEKGPFKEKQVKCFKAKDLPFYKRGYKTKCHILKGSMEQVLNIAKKYKATPTSVLVPLYSKALKKHIKVGARNKNVVCNVLIECRKRMGINTMHDFIISKNIAYIDKYDTMDMEQISKDYRSIIELASTKENIVKEATDMIKLVGILVAIRPVFLQRAVSKIVAKVLKHADNNFTFTYLGKLNFPEEVACNIQDFNFRSWTDFGESNVAAVDLNGTLILNICENYKNENIVPSFIELCREEGIELEELDSFEYEQANLRLKNI